MLRATPVLPSFARLANTTPPDDLYRANDVFRLVTSHRGSARSWRGFCRRQPTGRLEVGMFPQHLTDLALNDRSLKDVLRRGPLSTIPFEQLSDQLAHVVRKPSRNAGCGTASDLFDQLPNVGCIKRDFQGTKLKKNTSKSPDIRGPRIRSLLTDLWTQVVRSTNCGPRTRRCVVEHLGNPKITDLENVVFRQKHILRLQITVENVTIMHVLQSQRCL
mmetsp:Transcript_37485/g.81990  ORF Transcript_37485/g.81990 Transcript_37485/m.81990 type:complete len:218 (+) Transcript_37485:876-1529(+)